MKNDTRPQQARGIAEVSDIVQARMRCGWQDIDQVNDNGIDGIIIDRVDGNDTGSLYYVQVKCGNSYINSSNRRPAHLGIKLGREYIETHRPRWNALQGPAVLVYVDFHTRKAWWTDLKAASSYCPEQNRGIILIPKHQRFGVHSIGHLRKLRGYFDIDRNLDVIHLQQKDLLTNSLSKSLKVCARDFYKEWSSSPIQERNNPMLGEISVSRVGWRHITRRGRGADNIIQSWLLLGAAKRIILSNDKPYQIRRP
ncbi:MAG: DUF4365 domain-containing protein, partial [Bacteroidetes bacterium]|nr:DUF4365 domain-containing protein [Bacteroidota bacterium]